MSTNPRMSKIIQRIKTIEDIQTDVAVADLLNVTKDVFSKWRSRNSIPYDRLLWYCEKRGISMSWLLTGRGPERLLRESDKDKEIARLQGLLLQDSTLAIVEEAERLRKK